MTPRGIGLVARQDIKTRLRTGRWKTLLAVWFVIVNGLGLAFRLALEAGGTAPPGGHGMTMFGGVLLGVLMLTLLVTPVLGAQSINGDRERGTLAALQVTRLAPGDIALGKLAAAWGAGLLTLLLTLPSVLWPVVEGAVGPGRALVVLVITGLLIGVVCALSLAWSALLARSITAVLMSYLTVFALLAGTPLVYKTAVELTADSHYPDPGGGVDGDRSDRVWWLLAPNPVVVMADAAPRPPGRRYDVGHRLHTPPPSYDPLVEISGKARDIREGNFDGEAPMWQYGLLIDLALAAGAVRLTASRLRTPLYGAPKGVRVA